MATTSEPAEVRRAHRSELTPLAFLERSVLVYPDKVAVVHEDRRYTYREFGERVNRLASALRAAGLPKGGRVAFLCPNTPALLEAHYGVPAAGGRRQRPARGAPVTCRRRRGPRGGDFAAV
jgi:fatty-acyl-CoA synthase